MKTIETWHILEDGNYHHLVQTIETVGFIDTTTYYVDGNQTRQVTQPTINSRISPYPKRINYPKIRKPAPTRPCPYCKEMRPARGLVSHIRLSHPLEVIGNLRENSLISGRA